MATYTDKYTLVKPDEEDYYSIDDFNSNMDIIDDQLAEFEEKMEDIDTSVGSLNTRMDEINSSVGSGNEGIENVQTTVDGIDTNISSLKTTVDTIKTNVDTVNSNVASTKATVDSVSSAVNTINTTTSSTKTTIDTVNTNVSTIKSAVDSMNGYINGSSSSGSLLDEIQKSSGNKYYKPSNNKALQYSNVDITSLVSTSGNYKIMKFFDFVPEHSGSVRLYVDFNILNNSSTNSIYIYGYDKGNKDYEALSLFTPSSIIYPTTLSPTAMIERQVHNANYTVCDYEYTIDIPLIAGQPFYLIFYYVSIAECVINDLWIGYDVCIED